MNWRCMIPAALGLSLCAAAVAEAQQQSEMGPPPILVITRELAKAGKEPAHEKYERSWAKTYADAKWAVNYLGTSALTGEPRALFFSGYPSLADWEKDQQNLDKDAAFSAKVDALTDKDNEFLRESRLGVFRYLPELSHQAAVPIATMRYFVITSVVVKPGHGDHFSEIRRMVKAAHEKAGVNDHYAVYQLVAGGSPGHYLIIVPMKSLKEMDEAAALHGKAYQEAMGEEGRRKQLEFQGQGVESAETNIFAFKPAISYVSKDWIDADPEFWAPKPKPAAKPAAKKEAPKKP
ncbi:MAG TPA: hypothetical protein VEH49_06400 [Methylomirabilota bacterium]|nr:hypothetical protein [Methylomirabilota bacterium]